MGSQSVPVLATDCVQEWCELKTALRCSGKTDLMYRHCLNCGGEVVTIRACPAIARDGGFAFVSACVLFRSRGEPLAV